MNWPWQRWAESCRRVSRIRVWCCPGRFQSGPRECGPAWCRRYRSLPWPPAVVRQSKQDDCSPFSLCQCSSYTSHVQFTAVRVIYLWPRVRSTIRPTFHRAGPVRWCVRISSCTLQRWGRPGAGPSARESRWTCPRPCPVCLRRPCTEAWPVRLLVLHQRISHCGYPTINQSITIKNQLQSTNGRDLQCEDEQTLQWTRRITFNVLIQRITISWNSKNTNKNC